MRDFRLDEPNTDEVEVSEEELAAIDRGIADADAGVTPSRSARALFDTGPPAAVWSA